MRIIAKRLLRAFWKRHPRAKGPLEAWHQEVAHADWAGPSEVKVQFPSASILQGNCVVFNIAGNQYWLVVKINYPYRIVYVRFRAPTRATTTLMSTLSEDAEEP